VGFVEVMVRKKREKMRIQVYLYMLQRGSGRTQSLKIESRHPSVRPFTPTLQWQLEIDNVLFMPGKESAVRAPSMTPCCETLEIVSYLCVARYPL